VLVVVFLRQTRVKLVAVEEEKETCLASANVVAT
jgi:hypothetical protein